MYHHTCPWHVVFTIIILQAAFVSGLFPKNHLPLLKECMGGICESSFSSASSAPLNWSSTPGSHHDSNVNLFLKPLFWKEGKYCGHKEGHCFRPTAMWIKWVKGERMHWLRPPCKVCVELVLHSNRDPKPQAHPGPHATAWDPPWFLSLFHTFTI